MKFRYTRFRNGHVLICNVTKKEALNRREIDSLVMPPEGIMPIISFNEEKLTVIYEASDCVPIAQYFKKTVIAEEEALSLVRQFLTIMSNLEISRMTVQKLVMDINTAYYNFSRRMLELVFCPVQNNYSPIESKHIFGFMQDILTGAQISPGSGKVKAFTDFIRKQQSFSAEETASFLDSLIGDYQPFSHENTLRPVYDSPPPPVEAASLPRRDFAVEMPGNAPRSTPVYTEPVSVPVRTERSDVKITMHREPPAKPTITAGNRLQPLRSFSGGNSRPDSDTLTGSPSESEYYPEFRTSPKAVPRTSSAVLRNETTGAEFLIPKRSCIIGRIGTDNRGNTVAPDIAVTYNMRVGKHHAMIACDGNSYYITDLDSKNGTFVNGTRLPSGYDSSARRFNGINAKLSNGSRISLAGEAFVFLLNP